MLITAMLKNNKHNFKEQAKLYSSKYPTFFDEYDYRMTYATNEFENLIL